MDEIARLGVVGRADNVPASMPSGSDVATMSLFGYDPLKYHTGRAPLEAAAQGIELGPDDWAIRCNLVTIQNGVMVSFTAGQIPNDLARRLIDDLQTRPGQPRARIPPRRQLSQSAGLSAGRGTRGHPAPGRHRSRRNPHDSARTTSPISRSRRIFPRARGRLALRR